MAKFSKNESGFSIVELVMALVILALIGTVGWLVYNKDHKLTANPVAVTAKSAKSASVIPAAPAYFTIKEWGVRAPYSGKADVVYSIFADDPSSAWLSSQQLAAIDPNCEVKPNSGNVGYVGRYLPTGDIPTTDGHAETAQAFVTQDLTDGSSLSYSKVGQYYYIYWTGQQGCTTNPAYDTTVNQVIGELGNLVKGFQAVPN
jgi:hypothetical protein